MVLRALRTYRDILVERYRQPEDWVEVRDTGFVTRRKRWPFKPWERTYPWEGVREIHAYMRDCYIYPVLGLQFVYPDEKTVQVDERTSGWNAFRDTVFERFPGFNKDNLKTVEDYAPREGALLCWRAADVHDGTPGAAGDSPAP
jgi:hypothetical protein